MKHLLFILFTFLSFFSYSQVPDNKNELKHSLGLNFSPVQFTIWQYDFTVEIWSEKPKSISASLLSQSGISYQYRINNFLKLQSGLAYSHEHIDFSIVTKEDGFLDLNYSIYYTSIPIGIRLNPFNIINRNAKGGLFLQLNTDMDFSTREDIIKSTREYYDPRLPKPPGFVLPPVNKEETHSEQIRFNRIRPAVMIGSEVEGKHIVFSYAARLSLASLYQIENSIGYLKSIAINPIILGLNYRF